MGHAGVGWVIQGWVGHVRMKWSGSYMGGVGYAGVGSRNIKGVESHVYDIT